jgi:hypothetical protein
MWKTYPENKKTIRITCFSSFFGEKLSTFSTYTPVEKQRLPMSHFVPKSALYSICLLFAEI